MVQRKEGEKKRGKEGRKRKEEEARKADMILFLAINYLTYLTKNQYLWFKVNIQCIKPHKPTYFNTNQTYSPFSNELIDSVGSHLLQIPPSSFLGCKSSWPKAGKTNCELNFARNKSVIFCISCSCFSWLRCDLTSCDIASLKIQKQEY